jgi:hypothetical protein
MKPIELPFVEIMEWNVAEEEFHNIWNYIHGITYMELDKILYFAHRDFVIGPSTRRRSTKSIPRPVPRGNKRRQGGPHQTLDLQQWKPRESVSSMNVGI